MKNNETTLKTIVVIVFVCMILGIAGTGFGIYGTIQANRALSYLEGAGPVESGGQTISEGDDVEIEYGLPDSASEIDAVYITYNGGNDYIDIYDGILDYYTYDEEGEYVGEDMDANSEELYQYVFDNYLEYLGDSSPEGEETWAFEVSSGNKVGYVGGNGEEPEWFSTLLKKLNADEKGYKSKNL